MLELGVITRVDRPTNWVTVLSCKSQLKIREKIITKLRVCLDPRDLNKWIKREQHYAKTIDEMVTQLSNAMLFTLVDAKRKDIGTFHWTNPACTLLRLVSPLKGSDSPGSFRPHCFPGHIAETAQDSALKGLSDFTGIADDTFTFGSTEQEHNKNLANLVE